MPPKLHAPVREPFSGTPVGASLTTEQLAQGKQRGKYTARQSPSDPTPGDETGPRVARYILCATMNPFARWLARHARAVVIANLALAVVLGARAIHVRIENSLE